MPNWPRRWIPPTSGSSSVPASAAATSPQKVKPPQPSPPRRVRAGENVPALAGLTVAHVAYLASLGGQAPPVIDGFSADQRFYLGWAQVWRRNYREANIRQRVLTDPHALNPYRADIVRNMDPWYRAFDVKPGQKLYLTPEQRVRIW